jgi:hypothetical protein
MDIDAKKSIDHAGGGPKQDKYLKIYPACRHVVGPVLTATAKD